MIVDVWIYRLPAGKAWATTDSQDDDVDYETEVCDSPDEALADVRRWLESRGHQVGGVYRGEDIER